VIFARRTSRITRMRQQMIKLPGRPQCKRTNPGKGILLRHQGRFPNPDMANFLGAPGALQFAADASHSEVISDKFSV